MDGSIVLVSADQTIFALDGRKGNFLWMTSLPRQDLRYADSAWTKFSRYRELYLIQCYDYLVALRMGDGRLIWSFDCGAFGNSTPTVVGEKVLVGPRGR